MIRPAAERVVNSWETGNLADAVNELSGTFEEVDSALVEAEAALAGDSNDAEHDALVSMYEAVTGKTAPSPNYDEEEE